MIRITTRARVAATLAAAALTLGAACKPAGTGSNPPDTDTAVAPPPPVAIAQVVPDTGYAGYPGQNDEATRRYLMSIRWASDLPPSEVVDSALVDDGNQPRDVRIIPSDSAYHVDWDKAINGTGNGYYVAKIYNRSNAAIAALGIPGNQTGYLWVGRLNENERGVAIVLVRNNGNAQIAKKLSWDNFCATPHSRSKVELTDGKKCDARSAAQASASVPTTVMLASNVRPAPAASSSFLAGLGLWITCSGGCCEVKVRQETQ
jgi:hypothetical protein